MSDGRRPRRTSERAAADDAAARTAAGRPAVGAEHGRRGRRRASAGPRSAVGFGCLFGLVFLVVAGVDRRGRSPRVVRRIARADSPSSIAGSPWSSPWPRRGIERRRSGGRARTLDRLVEATRRVEAGDYTTRVGTPGPRLRPVARPRARLRHDGRAARARRGPAAHAAQRREPRAADPADGHRRQPRGDDRRRPPGRRGAPRARSSRRRGSWSGSSTTCGRWPCPRPARSPLHREPTDPDVLIDEVVRVVRGRGAATAGVTVTADVPADLPIVDVDPVRLREVLANLVANAVRHTPAGGTVTVRGPRRRTIGSAAGRRHGPGHRPGPAAPRLRPVREGRRVERIRARAWRSPGTSWWPTAARSRSKPRGVPAPRSGSACPSDVPWCETHHFMFRVDEYRPAPTSSESTRYDRGARSRGRGNHRGSPICVGRAWAALCAAALFVHLLSTGCGSARPPQPGAVERATGQQARGVAQYRAAADGLQRPAATPETQPPATPGAQPASARIRPTSTATVSSRHPTPDRQRMAAASARSTLDRGRA